MSCKVVLARQKNKKGKLDKEKDIRGQNSNAARNLHIRTEQKGPKWKIEGSAQKRSRYSFCTSEGKNAFFTSAVPSLFLLCAMGKIVHFQNLSLLAFNISSNLFSEEINRESSYRMKKILANLK